MFQVEALHQDSGQPAHFLQWIGRYSRFQHLQALCLSWNMGQTQTHTVLEFLSTDTQPHQNHCIIVQRMQQES